MKSFAEFLKDDLSSASILQWLCLREFGPEYISWDPEVLSEELDEYAEDIPQINKDKIHAGAYILRGNGHYIQFELFEKIGRTLNMNDPMFEAIIPLEPNEVCWAIIEIAILDPNEEQDVYEEEVKEYIKQVFHNDNILRAPSCISHVVNWDEMSDHNKTIQGLQIKYEKELNSFIDNRLRRIEKEYLDGFGRKLELKKELLPEFNWE